MSRSHDGDPSPDLAREQQYQREPDALTPAERVFACSSCGYDLRGLVVGAPCPECAKPITTNDPRVAGASTYAVVCLIAGLASYPSCLIYGVGSIGMALISVGCGIVALRRFRQGTTGASGHSLAVAGITFAVIAIIITSVFWGLVLLP